MALTPNAKVILASRYLRKDTSGKPIETPEDLFRRVAKNISLADVAYAKKTKVAAILKRHDKRLFEITGSPAFKALVDDDVLRTEERFYRMMMELDFLPNSPTLFNAGRELQQLAGCFVLPIEDSLDGIFSALREAALIHQSGGGTGFSFSHLRPRGDPVRSTEGVASGPVSFMKVFDAATEQIKQGGKRRGANMGILRIDHPDIEEFITAKKDPLALQNFNISVAVTDAFMKALTSNKRYALVHPRTKSVVAMTSARHIFRLICSTVWESGDPGMVFIDRINRDQPTPQLGVIESTNPCGEVPLLPYEACNLGSINLSRFVKGKQIDYPRLREVVWDAVHFLDNVIDMSNYPLPQIGEKVLDTRKVGLGVMGFADMLFQLGIPYDSRLGLETADELMHFIADEAKKASVSLAGTRGVFRKFEGSIYDTGKKDDRVRNATRTSIAPTGTLSILAGCSSGIEPVFALAFTHTVLEKKGLFEANRYLLKIAKDQGFYSDEFMQRLIENGTLQGMQAVPDDVRRVFVTAHDIIPEYHVRMQAAFQAHTDNAVSKTVNMPSSASVDAIAKVYLLAYESGCKGISIYRDTSKTVQVLTTGRTKPNDCPLC